MRKAAAGLIAIALWLASPVHAQESETVMAVEMRPAMGLFVPTGGMRHEFRNAKMVGFQGGLEWNSHTHLMLGGGWARTSSRAASLSNQRVDLWQFDAGAEFNQLHPVGEDWYFRPFVAAGAGVRVYDYAAIGVGSHSATLGYGSIGAEAQRHTNAIRLEVRDNVTSYESVFTSRRTAHNDVSLMLSFVVHLR